MKIKGDAVDTLEAPESVLEAKRDCADGMTSSVSQHSLLMFAWYAVDIFLTSSSHPLDNLLVPIDAADDEQQMHKPPKWRASGWNI